MRERLKEIIYGNQYLRYCIYDTCLNLFAVFQSNYISYEQIYKHKLPSDFESVIDFLAKEDYLSKDRYGIHITEKGKLKVRSGGFKRQLLRDRIAYFSVILGIITGIIGLIVTFFRFSCKLFPLF